MKASSSLGGERELSLGWDERVKASSLIFELPSSGKSAVMSSPLGEGAVYGLRWAPVARTVFDLFDGSVSSYECFLHFLVKCFFCNFTNY